MNMYQSLLEVVTESYAQNYYNCDRFLCQLQGSVRQLRQHYQNYRVTVDYSQPNIQAAYLLAYYPHYVQHQVLAQDMDSQRYRLATAESLAFL